MPNKCEHIQAKWIERANGNKVLICPECKENIQEIIKFGNEGNNN